MINKRNETFETNSSSTHAICIVKKSENIKIPNSILIDLNEYEFGWDFCKIKGYNNKLAYILIGILKYNDIIVASEKTKKLILFLNEIGIKDIEIQGINIENYNSKNVYFNIGDGYIDHSNELSYFIDILLEDEELLKRYLFDNESFIATGNDNDNRAVIDEATIKETHEIYWKGN